MTLTNTQLCYYDSNVLRLPADKRKEYHAQVDRLIAELSRPPSGQDGDQDHQGSQGGVIRKIHDLAQDVDGPGGRRRRVLHLRTEYRPGNPAEPQRHDLRSPDQ